jgi:hypothetical protein
MMRVSLSAVVALSFGTAPVAAATAKDRVAYIRSWSIACQTRGAQGARLTTSELEYIKTFVFTGVESRIGAYQAFGGKTRDLAKVRAEVCTCAATRLSQRSDLAHAPSNDLLFRSISECANDTPIAR